MSEYSQIFYIDPEDNIEKIKDQIRLSTKEKVVLVFPEENKNLKNIESLTILKKESQNLGKKVTIYSTDPFYKKIAEDCGIEIEDSLIGGSFFSKKGEVSFRPPVSDILPRQEPAEEKSQEEVKKIIIEKETSKKEEKTEKVSPQKQEIKAPEERKETHAPLVKKTTRKTSPLAYIFLILVVSLGIFLALTWLPKADILVIPSSEKVDFSGNFIVERGADFDLGEKILPGTIVAKEKTIEKTFSVTAEQEKSEKATGTITIYNKDSSSHKFVLGTRFETSDGKIFRSQSTVSVPAGNVDSPSTVDVGVVADKAGQEYNINSTTFTLPGLKGTALYDKVSGKSAKSMNGGFVGTTKVVSKNDITNAKKEIQELQEKTISDLKTEALKGFSQNLDFLKDYFVVEDGEITFDKKEGDIGDSFKGTTKVKVKVLTFKEQDIQKIISNIVSGKIKEGIQFHEILETQNIEYKVSNKQASLEMLKISFDGDESVAWKVDENEIKKDVKGKNPEEFKKYITESTKGKIKDAQLTLWPFWVNKIPTRDDRIKIVIQYK